jgi:hypothetical protein
VRLQKPIKSSREIMEASVTNEGPLRCTRLRADFNLTLAA